MSSSKLSDNLPTSAGDSPAVFPSIDSKLFGMPRYQPFVDSFGEEAGDEARVWATYLDEAESHDHDMIRGFRDTIDSLLVLAGLFSAIVATFVAQTSQALKPNYAQLNLLVQIEQTQLLRVGGNLTAMATVPQSGITMETSTYTRADLWINGLFFTSLSISMSTALLAVLIKQWCQAYTSVTSGSARDKCLTRQFRFDGLMKWKLPEIVGSLPLLLHVGFGVFFAGLSYFVYDLHATLSSIVIIATIAAAVAYCSTVILPAIWLECPYRIPLLFRPARFVVFACLSLYRIFQKSAAVAHPLSQYLPPGDWMRAHVFTSLKHAEEVLFAIPSEPQDSTLSPRMMILARSFSWLFYLSKNKSTRRIVASALHGCLLEDWGALPPLRNLSIGPQLTLFLQTIPFSSIAEVAFTSVITFREEDKIQVPAALLDILSDLHQILEQFSDLQFPSPFSQDTLDNALCQLMSLSSVHPDARKYLLQWGANVNYLANHPFPRTPLSSAVRSGSLENVRWLLAEDASVNDFVSGRTALMRACWAGHFAIAKCLIEYGANVNLVGLSSTALELALFGRDKPNFEFIDYLLDYGARLEESLSEPGDTVLYRAVRAGEVEALRFLLRRGATVNSKLAHPGNIPWLQNVSDDSRHEIERMLREHRAKPSDHVESSLKGLHCLPHPPLSPVLCRQQLA
ncbi:hypothetical protein DL96DRAFT_1560760 [Flagelloscypha sp. PMI_526]|nr:hypothetical protein DL96DRAFT_1560760 [Flagelloscypha sp. PMI_526]